MKLKLGNAAFTLFIIIIAFILYHIVNSNSLMDLDSNPSTPYPTELHPIVEERSSQLVQQAAEKGIVIVITDGFRSSEYQDKLFEKGRSTEGSIVTNAKGGQSYHNFGLAIDFALKSPTGDVLWDMEYDGNKNGKPDWNEVVEIAKSLGFEWGGDWKDFKDYPHLEMNFGLSLAQLRQGERPPDSSLTADK